MLGSAISLLEILELPAEMARTALTNWSLTRVITLLLIVLNIYLIWKILRFAEVKLRNPVVRVLWLRKFDADKSKFFKFSHLIDRLYRYNISPVFLSDKSLEVSPSSKGYRTAQLFIPVAILLQIALFALTVYYWPERVSVTTYGAPGANFALAQHYNSDAYYYSLIFARSVCPYWHTWFCCHVLCYY